MMKIKTLFALTFLFIAQTSFCCYCIGDNTPLRDYVKKYSFIALIRVVGFDENKARPIRTTGETKLIKFEILELFKGQTNAVVYETSINTSCDKGIRYGGEWLLFCTTSADSTAVITGPCDQALQLRNADGERTGFDVGKQITDSLRIVLNMPVAKKLNGIHREYFPNGKLSVIEHYQNGVLNGNRKIYSVNGRLSREENFKQGIHDGVQRTYARSGQLLWEYETRNEQLGNSRMWYDTSFEARRGILMKEMLYRNRAQFDSFVLATPIKLQLQIEAQFNDETGVRLSKHYTWDGTLEQVMQLDTKTKLRISTSFFKSGAMQSEDIHNEIDKTDERKEWDEQGKLVSHKKWKNGKLLGDEVSK
jgi:antitoxin component YwqK of YwqJK toxin-antitoxin module